jgi:hypothetical protein
MPLVLPSYTAGAGEGSADGAVPGTGLSVPTGVEAVLEYNGLYFNVTTTIDKIRVKEIGGLDDADIRDAREANPGDHGETPYKALYGGRTITLSGTIEAYSLEKLRDMQAAIRRAFNDISRERPLIFHTGVYDRDYYIDCKKSQPIQMRESQGDMRFFREFLITLRASNPRIQSYKQRTSMTYFGYMDDFSTDTLSRYNLD